MKTHNNAVEYTWKICNYQEKIRVIKPKTTEDPEQIVSKPVSRRYKLKWKDKKNYSQRRPRAGSPLDFSSWPAYLSL